ncbi:GNAT family N-acetyltransferase [Evansella sp. AB-P1]|uniref:GNAT family N-acetyltransferase n=1 Tax=Evansella sp. AB-P1 TaxID=3037653 RepID=UPI00241EFE09|nr:GNAT family N-acetyltransferase [Evansella sp. AB-P1]MDG5788059.1 GNAT family N-acetyltransferase [Evansella sp. AB-P1]
MDTISFHDINKLGNIVEETELYRQFHFQKMLIMYDSNYLEFKRMPSLLEFKEKENYLKSYHQKYKQNHLKFHFPENEKLSEELKNYLANSPYDIGFNELYTILPSQFPYVDSNGKIDIQVVTNRNLQAFLDLNYKHDSEYGKQYAIEKGELLKEQFHDSKHLQLVANYEGISVGYVHIIISDGIVEIDNLHVDQPYQKKGIGSQLQKAVMDTFPDKRVILIADGEDTPKEMYRKQNYQYMGYQYEALKTY